MKVYNPKPFLSFIFIQAQQWQCQTEGEIKLFPLILTSCDLCRKLWIHGWNGSLIWELGTPPCDCNADGGQHLPFAGFPQVGLLQRAETRLVSNSKNRRPVLFVAAELPGLYKEQRGVTLFSRSQTEQHVPTINTWKILSWRTADTHGVYNEPFVLSNQQSWEIKC